MCLKSELSTTAIVNPSSLIYDLFCQKYLYLYFLAFFRIANCSKDELHTTFKFCRMHPIVLDMDAD